LRPGEEIVITGDPQAANTRELLTALNLNYTPNKVAIVKTDQNADQLNKFAGYTDGLEVLNDRATAHICRDGSCTGSTTDTQTMLDKILAKKA
jgi:hypothetical protein